ncbi:MAG: hypothetical protein KME21_00840 [Desmonostoc vinosum HA7617-LM4]|nr:hypothetical protein [Desmonostoc vinosum HA7617-LM4]
MASDENQAIKFWDIRTGHCIRTFQGYSSGVWAIAVSPPPDNSHGQILASGHEDQTVKLYRSPRPYEGMNITKTGSRE